MNRLNVDIQAEVVADYAQEEARGIVSVRPQDEVKTTDGDYRVGDKVIHEQFGEGIIIAINRNIGQIFFDKTKKLSKILLTHSGLKKK